MRQLQLLWLLAWLSPGRVLGFQATTRLSTCLARTGRARLVASPAQSGVDADPTSALLDTLVKIS